MTAKLQTGDILIFEAEDNFVSKCIAFLTKSTVSHSAMLMPESNIVEMVMEGIALNAFIEDTKGDIGHVLRLKSPQPSAPLEAAAKRYLDAAIPYDFPALVLLSGLMIFRDICPTQKLPKITGRILRAACRELDTLLQKLLKHEAGGMVCSQLVYQCYLDCGDAYKIVLTDPLLESTPEGSVRLASLIEEASGRDQSETPENEHSELQQEDEQLAEELYSALTQAPEQDVLAAQDSFRTVLPIAKKFLAQLEEVLEKSHSDLPLEALFVTLADLLHTENLENITTITITRCTE